jgi:hypothetical protein
MSGAQAAIAVAVRLGRDVGRRRGLDTRAVTDASHHVLAPLVQCPAPQFPPLPGLFGSLPEPKVIGARCPPLETLPGTWRRPRPAPAAEKRPGKPLAQGTEYGLARWARCGLAGACLSVAFVAFA